MPLLWLLLFFAPAARFDLDTLLAKWKPVQMPFDAPGLDQRQRSVIHKLVAASHEMESIYWRQADPEGLQLYRTTKNDKLKHLLLINGSRFDLIGENKPFVGSQPLPPGRGLYPKGLTRAQIEDYVKQHPDQKDAIYSPYTVLRWNGPKLETVPYHVEYREFLDPASRLLREAADLSEDAPFAEFLRLRADALLSDDYYPSDLAWLDLASPKIDVILAPYESYLDDVLGVKTSYESSVLVRSETESQKLDLYRKYVPDIQDALPLTPEDRPSKRGHLTPMEVMDAPFRAGDLRHGYQAVADNLPNDPRIHQAKGTKKIFFKNFMDARVKYVVLPLAQHLMNPDQAAKASGEGYLAAVVLHEISHGLGPAYARIKGAQKDIREAIGPVYGALEEAKADVAGMFGLQWLIDKSVLDKTRTNEYYASYVAGIFRTLRYGTAEAHGRAEMMEFNYLFEQKAITEADGRYKIDFTKTPQSLRSLTKELLEIEATGDRGRAEAWFNRYDKMPKELQSALTSVKDVPVDIDPKFSFPDKIR